MISEQTFITFYVGKFSEKQTSGYVVAGFLLLLSDYVTNTYILLKNGEYAIHRHLYALWRTYLFTKYYYNI